MRITFDEAAISGAGVLARKALFVGDMDSSVSRSPMGLPLMWPLMEPLGVPFAIPFAFPLAPPSEGVEDIVAI